MEETGKKFNPTEYKNNFNKTNYYEFKLRIPKESKEILERLSLENNISINKLVIDAIEKTYNVIIK